MRDDDNPYAAPQARIVSADLAACSEEFCWRQGDRVVVLKGQPLPPRCIKCNAANVVVKSRRFYWVKSSVYLPLALMILMPLATPLFLLISLVLHLLMRKSSRHIVGMCEQHDRRRRLAMMAGLAMLGIGPAVITVWTESFPFALLLMGIGIVTAAVGSQTLSAAGIDDQCGYYRGCGKAFLESLSQQPPEDARGARDG